MPRVWPEISRRSGAATQFHNLSLCEAAASLSVRCFWIVSIEPKVETPEAAIAEALSTEQLAGSTRSCIQLKIAACLSGFDRSLMSAFNREKNFGLPN
jgi:hypothetical protein